MSGYGGYSNGNGYYQPNAYHAPAASQHRSAPYASGGSGSRAGLYQQQQPSASSYHAYAYNQASHHSTTSSRYENTSSRHERYDFSKDCNYSSLASNYGPIRNPPRVASPRRTGSSAYYQKPVAKPAAKPAVKHRRVVSLAASQPTPQVPSQSKPVAQKPDVLPPSEETGTTSRLKSVVMAKMAANKSSATTSSRKVSDSDATSDKPSAGKATTVLRDIDTNKPIPVASSSSLQSCVVARTTASATSEASTASASIRKSSCSTENIDLVTPKLATTSKAVLSKRNSNDKSSALTTLPSSGLVDLTTPARIADPSAASKSTAKLAIVTPAAAPRLESVRNRVAAVMTPSMGRQYMVTPGQDYVLTPDSVVPAAQSFSRSTLYYHNSEISLHESSTVEFKAAGGGNAYGNYHRDVFHEHVDRYVSGFLNSQKGGLLMLGVADNGRVLGMHAPPLVQRSMEDTLRDRLYYFTPRISSKYYTFSFKPVYSQRGRHMQDLYVAVLEVFPLTASADLTTIFETRSRRAYMKCDGSVQEMTVQKIVEHVKASYDLVLKDRLAGKT